MNLERLIDLEHLGLTEDDLVGVRGQRLAWFRRDEDPAVTLLRIMREPENFYLTCKLLLGIEVAPFQLAIIDTLWNHQFPMLVGSRGAGKSFLLGLYSVLRATFVQGSKIVITGMGFRQAKQVLGYAEKHWYDSGALRSLFAGDSQSGPKHNTDRWQLRLGDSIITGLPMGDGSSIRGERANVVIGDEFASISREIFETVVAGFGVVSLNPIEQVRNAARIRVLQRLKVWNDHLEEMERNAQEGNQLIISGTAYYQFNHFYTYWKRWKGIIDSRGDERLLREALVENGAGGDAKELPDHRDYAIVRIPVELLPDGFMDKKQVIRSRQTIHTSAYLNEFSACFASDSNGFFRRTLLETCITRDAITPLGSSDAVRFDVMLRGDPTQKYIYGIDPASENDRFSIVIIEVHEGYRKVVYCWTTNRAEHRRRLEKHNTEENNFYGFAVRKIRDLMKVFPCSLICLDSQGGGRAVIEGLRDTAKLNPDEQVLHPIAPGHPLHNGKPLDTDNKAGLHIVEMVSFADAKYVSDANHGMRKDFEDKALLFPDCDPLALAIASEEDELMKREFDTHEDVVHEINELIDELTTITHSQTPGTLRDHWDTPEEKLPGGRKGRYRKDRYSALLMANHAARRLIRHEAMPQPESWGGFVQYMGDDDRDAMIAATVHGPAWWTDAVASNFEDYGCV